MAHADGPERLEVLEPTSRRSVADACSELWHHRDLVYLLAWRDVAVRYKQALFGFAWAVIQPIVLAVAFTLFLSRMARPSETGMPYSVYALSGLVPWTYFANAAGSASESLVGSSNLISKVYFPRLAIPVAALIAWLPDFGIATIILAIAMGFAGVSPGLAVVALPLVVLLTVLATVGVSVWTSAVNVAYRDVRYAVPFAIQLWLFATPVIYSAKQLRGLVGAVYGLNPMVGVIEAWRWALLDVHNPPWTAIGSSTVVILVVLVTGLRYFQRVERFFADVI